MRKSLVLVCGSLTLCSGLLVRTLVRWYSTSCRIHTRSSVRCYSAPTNDDSWEKWEYGTFAAHPNSEEHKQAMLLSAQHIESIWASTPHRPEELWGTITDENVRVAIEALRKQMTHERMTRMQHVLAHRTVQKRFVFENPSNPNNVWAALRTFDCFGVQNVDVIVDDSQYSKKYRKSHMVTALGSQKWVSLAKHSGAEQCLQELKARGFKICATDIHNASVSIYDMDWSGKCAIVLGNEDRGVSEDVRRMADVSFHIPMLGFAESLNLGVASAVITSFLAGAKQLEPNMPSNVQDRVLLTWMSRTVPGALLILRRAGIVIDSKTVHTTILGYTTK